MAFIIVLDGGYMYSNDLTCDVLSYINENINKYITIEELSNMFYFDKTYIMKRFKKEIGITVFEYINIIRIYNSLKYYNYDTYILSIAINNGFNSLEYYSEIFKKIMGVSPIIYKKYIDHDIKIREKDIKVILNNLNRIKSIKEKAIQYINNRKPKTKMVKNLSLEIK